MRILSKTPLLRWIVPVAAAVLLLGGGWAATRLTASAQERLPSRTAAQLLVDVQQARLDGLSGTIVQRADLGIPALPGGTGSSDLTSLVSGSHTLRVWFSGPDRARLALMGTLGESDVVWNGSDLWTWSSRDKSATHRTVSLPAGGHTGDLPGTGSLPVTPQQAAEQALKAIEPTTRVDTTGTATVAGRPAYELVLSPKDAASLVGQVRIAIDGTTHVPLRVQVVPRGSSTPGFEVGYTHFDPTRPDPAQFTFNPPPGTKVTEEGALGSARPKAGAEPGAGTPSDANVVGSGWTSVLVTRLPAGSASGAGLPHQLAQVLTALPKVSGSWGSGRLLRGTLFSAVLTDDGRVAVGAVAPDTLYRALAAR